MLSQLYATAIRVRQDKEDAEATIAKKLFLEAKTTHIPLIKAALMKAAERGDLFTSYVFPGLCFTSLVYAPTEAVQADVIRFLNEWFAEEPEWNIPYGFKEIKQDSRPGPIAIGMCAGTHVTVWFDFSKPRS